MARILAILPDHPYPLDMGSRVRNLRILEALAERFELTILTQVHDRQRIDAPGPVARLGRWVPFLAPHRRGLAPQVAWHLLGRVAAAREGLHRETFFLSLPPFARCASRLVAETRPDLVHVAYWFTLRHLASRPRPPVWVVDTHDVQFERHERLWGRRSPRERSAEIRELKRYDRVIAITERDRNTFRDVLGPAPPCDVIEMGVDLTSWSRDAVQPALPAAPRVVFYGNLGTSANHDAALHLLGDLLPLVRERVPEVQALLLGASPGAELQAAAARACVPTLVTGFLEDVRAHLVSAQVCALSLRTGSGLRSRVLESLALAVPVVSYPEALEGVDVAEGQGVISVRSPGEFADAVVSLLRDPARARALGSAGRERVSARYGPEATYRKLPRLYLRLLANQANERATR